MPPPNSVLSILLARNTKYPFRYDNLHLEVITNFNMSYLLTQSFFPSSWLDRNELGVRFFTIILTLLCLPLIFIPPCTCIYPFIAILLFFRTGEIPEDISRDMILSKLFSEMDYIAGNITDLSLYLPDALP